jgi:hypothetical protein
MALIVSNPFSLETEFSISNRIELRLPKMPERFLERWCIVVSYVLVERGKLHKWPESLKRNTPNRFYAEEQDDSCE